MSIFPTKILFAADGSRDAELAATTALGLARATGSELYVVTIAEEYPHHDAYRPLAKRSRQLAREVLDKQLERIENLGGTVDQTYLRIGTAAEEVVSLAEEIGAGLVAMGSRGRGRLRRLAMGSVSDAVVRYAHCPVMVVRGKPVVFPARILLATDGSEEATLALQTVGGPSRPWGSWGSNARAWVQLPGKLHAVMSVTHAPRPAILPQESGSWSILTSHLGQADQAIQTDLL